MSVGSPLLQSKHSHQDITRKKSASALLFFPCCSFLSFPQLRRQNVRLPGGWELLSHFLQQHLALELEGMPRSWRGGVGVVIFPPECPGKACRWFSFNKDILKVEQWQRLVMRQSSEGLKAEACRGEGWLAARCGSLSRCHLHSPAPCPVLCSVCWREQAPALPVAFGLALFAQLQHLSVQTKCILPPPGQAAPLVEPGAARGSLTELAAAVCH